MKRSWTAVAVALRQRKCVCGGARVQTESAVETKGQKQVRRTGTRRFTRMNRWMSQPHHPQDTELR